MEGAGGCFLQCGELVLIPGTSSKCHSFTFPKLTLSNGSGWWTSTWSCNHVIVDNLLGASGTLPEVVSRRFDSHLSRDYMSPKTWQATIPPGLVQHPSHRLVTQPYSKGGLAPQDRGTDPQLCLPEYQLTIGGTPLVFVASPNPDYRTSWD